MENKNKFNRDPLSCGKNGSSSNTVNNFDDIDWFNYSVSNDGEDNDGVI